MSTKRFLIRLWEISEMSRITAALTSQPSADLWLQGPTGSKGPPEQHPEVQPAVAGWMERVTEAGSAAASG